MLYRHDHTTIIEQMSTFVVQAHHAADLYAAVLRVERAIYREREALPAGQRQ